MYLTRDASTIGLIFAEEVFKLWVLIKHNASLLSSQKIYIQVFSWKGMKSVIMIIAILMLLLIGCASSVEEQDTMEGVEVPAEVDDMVKEEAKVEFVVEPEAEAEPGMEDTSKEKVAEDTTEASAPNTYTEDIDITVKAARVTRNAGDGTDAFTVEFLIENVGQSPAEVERLVLRHAVYDNVTRFRYEGPISYTLGVGEEMWIESPVPGEIDSSTDLNVDIRGRIDAHRDSDEQNDRFEFTIEAAKTA